MTQAELIIGRFGGLTALAKALGHKHPTTVQGWKNSGFIPSHRHREVMIAAHSNNIELTPNDFFEGFNGST